MYLPMEIDKSEKRELAETEWEIRKQLSSNPQFIYSEFMKSSLDIVTREFSSMECLFDTFQVMTDLLAGKRYSAMNKFVFFFLVFRRKDLCEGKYDAWVWNCVWNLAILLHLFVCCARLLASL